MSNQVQQRQLSIPNKINKVVKLKYKYHQWKLKRKTPHLVNQQVILIKFRSVVKKILMKLQLANRTFNSLNIPKDNKHRSRFQKQTIHSRKNLNPKQLN